jgi:hypothetical protein
MSTLTCQQNTLVCCNNTYTRFEFTSRYYLKNPKGKPKRSDHPLRTDQVRHMSVVLPVQRTQCPLTVLSQAVLLLVYSGVTKICINCFVFSTVLQRAAAAQHHRLCKSHLILLALRLIAFAVSVLCMLPQILHVLFDKLYIDKGE